MARTRPELVADKWRLDKDPEDKLWYVANVLAQLTDSATTATSFEIIVQGVEKLEQASPQGTSGSLLAVKLGSMGAPNTESFVTWRVTCANGEQFDRTLYFDRVSN